MPTCRRAGTREQRAGEGQSLHHCALALPDSPANDFSLYGGWFPPVALAATTLLIPRVVGALGQMPPTNEEERAEPRLSGGPPRRPLRARLPAVGLNELPPHLGLDELNRR